MRGETSSKKSPVDLTWGWLAAFAGINSFCSSYLPPSKRERRKQVCLFLAILSHGVLFEIVLLQPIIWDGCTTLALTRGRSEALFNLHDPVQYACGAAPAQHFYLFFTPIFSVLLNVACGVHVTWHIAVSKWGQSCQTTAKPMPPAEVAVQ